MPLPPECMEGTFYSHGGVALAITVLGLVYAVYAFARATQWLNEETGAVRTGSTPPDRSKAKAWLLGIWLLLPPVWLFCEDIFLYRMYGKPACFDFFRHAQHLVATGWIATLAVLTLLFFGRQILGRI